MVDEVKLQFIYAPELEVNSGASTAGEEEKKATFRELFVRGGQQFGIHVSSLHSSTVGKAVARQTFYCHMSMQHNSASAILAVPVHNGHERYGRNQSLFRSSFELGSSGTFETPGFIRNLDGRIQLEIHMSAPYWIILSIRRSILPGEEQSEEKCRKIYRQVEDGIPDVVETVWKKLNGSAPSVLVPTQTPSTMVERMRLGEKMYDAHMRQMQVLEEFYTGLKEKGGASNKLMVSKIASLKQEYLKCVEDYRKTTTLPPIPVDPYYP
jgi:hypothetical protein